MMELLALLGTLAMCYVMLDEFYDQGRLTKAAFWLLLLLIAGYAADLMYIKLYIRELREGVTKIQQQSCQSMPLDAKQDEHKPEVTYQQQYKP